MKILKTIEVKGNFFNANGVVQLPNSPEFSIVSFSDPNLLDHMLPAKYRENQTTNKKSKGIPMEIHWSNEVYPASFAPDNYNNLKARKDNDKLFYNASNSYRFSFPKEIRSIMENEFLFSKYMIRINNHLNENDKKNKEKTYGESVQCEFKYDEIKRTMICTILGFTVRPDNDIVEVLGDKVTVKVCRFNQELFEHSGNTTVKALSTVSGATAAPVWNQPTDWFDFSSISKDRNTCTAVYMWIGKSDLRKERYLYIGIAGATKDSKNSVYARITAEQNKFSNEIAKDFEIVKYRYSQLHPHPEAPVILQTVEMQTINEMNSLFREAPGKPTDATIKNHAIFSIRENIDSNEYPLLLLNDKKRYKQV